MIQYPVARDAAGAALRIEDWERGQAVSCFGCGEALVGRLPHDGIKPTAHFAHRPEAECNGETALHKAAKAAIVKAHADGLLRALSWDCPHCRRCHHATDISDFALRTETSPCAGVVSDVLALASDGAPRAAIEVVVTHDLEPATLERYRASGIWVYVFRPSWGSVGDIVSGTSPLVVELRVGAVDADSCPGCRELAREKAEWEARLHAQRATAWWTSWIAVWRWVGSGAQMQLLEETCALAERTRRDLARQRAWETIWTRIARQIAETWWVEWRQAWREIGMRHEAPYRWHVAWCSVWLSVARQYALDEIERAKRRREQEERAASLGKRWWEAWLKMWPEIAKRESGTIAAWRPICRQCRQDLTRDPHVCPRAGTACP